jgi:pentafunctional AROM polypeptide
MTVSLMRDFGVDVQVSADKRTYTIPKVFSPPSLGFYYIYLFFNQKPYVNPPHFEVESDASSSTYPLVMAAITGGKVTALNVTSKSLQVHFTCLPLRALALMHLLGRRPIL